MSDDFDSLFDTPLPVAAPAAGVASTAVVPALPAGLTPSAAAPEMDAMPAIWIALYKSGTSVLYEGQPHTVSHVHISRKGLFIRLMGKDGVVPAEKVNVPMTRVVLPMGAYLSPRLLRSPTPGPARTK